MYLLLIFISLVAIFKVAIMVFIISFFFDTIIIKIISIVWMSLSSKWSCHIQRWVHLIPWRILEYISYTNVPSVIATGIFILIVHIRKHRTFSFSLDWALYIVYFLIPLYFFELTIFVTAIWLPYPNPI